MLSTNEVPYRILNWAYSQAAPRPDQRKRRNDLNGNTKMIHGEEFPPPFKLGTWLVQPDRNRISGPDGDSQMEPRVMLVLLLLAKRPGEVWSRQALLDEIWKDSVVGEEILTRAISELRRAFKDKARDPLYIETIRNHGYRLIETPQPRHQEGVEQPEATPDSSAAPELPSTPPPPVAVAAKPSLNKFIVPFFALVLVILAVVLGGKLLNLKGGKGSQLLTYSGARPLTSFPGREWHPALSADGNRVAFVWSSPEDESTDIYVKQRNSESLLRLTEDPGWVAWPTWSPDGQTIAFVQDGPDGGNLCLVPSLGGPVRVLHSAQSLVEGLDFSPDGQSLLFSAREGKSGKFTISLLNLQDLSVERWNPEADQRAGDFQPRFAPDGESLAWVGVGFNGNSRILRANFADGVVHQVGGELANLQGLAYAADGQHIIYSASPAGTFNLWQIPVDAGKDAAAHWLPTPGEFAWNPGVARRSGDLVFEQVRVDQDIWGIHILQSNPWQMETSPFLESTRWEYEADFSADGNQVAFISARSGSPELWLADGEGNNLRQLTHLGSAGLTNPRFSPNGEQLAFNALQDGRTVIMAVAVRGGDPKILSPHGIGEIFCSWSEDGKSLLYGVDQAGSWDIRRRYLLGGKTSLVIAGGAITAQESDDGDFLFFTRLGKSGLWSVALDGDGQMMAGERPHLVLGELSSQDRHNWALGQGKIYWVLRTGGPAMLAVTDLASGYSSLLTELAGMTSNGLAVSPDGSLILYPKTGPMEGDLMVSEGLKK